MERPNPSDRARIGTRAGRARRAAIVLWAALDIVAAPGRAGEHPVGGDLLRLRDPAAVTARRAHFRAARDPAIVPGASADPRRGGATLEITGSGPGDGATGPIVLAAAGWSGLGKPAGTRGYVFVSRGGTQGGGTPGGGTRGVRKVVLKAARGGGTLAVTARGAGWPYAIGQPQSAVDVRFTVGDEVYCAGFTRFLRNTRGRLLARQAPPPATCSRIAAPCGNGTIEGTEECDDGNTTAGDGCAGDCQLESTAALCAGVPSVAGAALGTVRIASGLQSPLYATAPRLDPNRLFVVEQAGRIRVIENGALLPQAFLDVSGKVACCGERGLLGLAFHPDYERSGRFFVYYTDPSGDLVIARYQATADPDVADPASEQVLLTIPHPGQANHNGGQLAFGPDGFLYAGIGDGGGGGDPGENAQSGTSLLGKVLRLDVDAAGPPFYRAPPTNPFAGPGDPRDEIWALGLRNPWRFSFDRSTGELYIGDVGQGAWEEVDVQPAASAGGENYGWDVFEGDGHCFEPTPPATACPAPPTGFTMPVFEYGHAAQRCGGSITGGYVYRGCRLPALHGTYFHADFCTGVIRSFRRVLAGVAQSPANRTAELAPGGGLSIDSPSSFGEDARGELYIVDYDGDVFQIVPAS